MINELTLKFGPARNGPPLVFSPGAVTIFVGPNNSGKSLVLREIGSASRASAAIRASTAVGALHRTDSPANSLCS